MKTLKLISAAILLATMHAAGATEYYVCDTGSDSNDGLSPDTPIATASKAISIFNAISAGDSVLFCRGGKFTVANDLRIYNPNCQTSNPCTLADYQPPSGQLPNLPVLTQTGGNYLFRFEDSSNADHDEGYAIKNLMLTGLNTGTGMFFYNDVDDVTIDSVVFNTFDKGAYEGGSNAPNEGSDAKNERITITNASFINVAKNTASKNTGSITISSSTTKTNTSTGSTTDSTSSSTSDTSGPAATYYVCDNGNDANSGLSVDKPWQTFEKAMATFNSMKAGNAIAFCRGGKFTLKNTTPPRLYNSNCSAAALCRIEDYYQADATKKAKPLFVNTGGGIFNFQDPSAANKDGGYILKNLSLKGGGIGEGVFLYNDVDDVTIDNLTIDSFEEGIQSSTSNATLLDGVNGKNDRLKVRNSVFSNNFDQGFLGTCDNCLIEGNTFENNGFTKKMLNHNIYIGGKNAKNITIKNNKLHKSAIVDGKCNGVSLVVHGVVNGLTIDNNVIYEDIGAITPYCWGIAVDPGWSTEEQFTNVTITNNKISNVANVAIGCASCGNVLISKNTITSSQQENFWGIKVPNKADDAYKSNQVTITGNNISVSSAAKLFGIRVPTDSSLYKVESNIISYKSTSSICIDPAALALIGGNVCTKTD